MKVNSNLTGQSAKTDLLLTVGQISWRFIPGCSHHLEGRQLLEQRARIVEALTLAAKSSDPERTRATFTYSSLGKAAARPHLTSKGPGRAILSRAQKGEEPEL